MPPVHGGVLPYRQQGSIVTYIVAPSAESRSDAIAPFQRASDRTYMVSLAHDLSILTITALTFGLGLTHPVPFLASSIVMHVLCPSISSSALTTFLSPHSNKYTIDLFN